MKIVILAVRPATETQQVIVPGVMERSYTMVSASQVVQLGPPSRLLAYALLAMSTVNNVLARLTRVQSVKQARF